MGFDFSVEYKPGASYTVADALSRRDTEEGSLLAISTPHFDFVDRLRLLQTSDPALVALRDDIVAGQQGTPWSVIDNMVA